ncbi:MAG: glycosyltransferase family 1 protein [Acidimicrobiales bacterium]|nr:glycosyltransferase family 1 protein [Acidimicrobiales bacterium]
MPEPEAGAPSNGARHVALVGHRLAAPAATGIGRYYAEIASGLARTADPATHRYTVASTREPGSPSWVAPPLGLGSLGGPRRALAMAWALTGRPAVDRRLGHPALVHLLHPWAPVPTRAPLVATVHDLMPLLHPEWYGRVERWSYRRGIHHVRADAAAVVAVSQWSADQLVAEAGIERDRIHVVWEGAGDEFRHRPTTAEQAAVCRAHGVEPGRFLVAIGAVSTRKNLAVVLRALAQVDPALLGSPALVVAGPAGQGAAEVEAAVDRLGLTGRVRFAGYVPGGELPVLLGASMALVHPSRDEGFGITPIEAMAAGVPALASDAGAIPEVAGEAALLVGLDDVDGWAAAITAVATDEGHRADLVRRGTDHQARFTWDRAAEATRAVHDAVLDVR